MCMSVHESVYMAKGTNATECQMLYEQRKSALASNRILFLSYAEFTIFVLLVLSLSVSLSQTCLFLKLCVYIGRHCYVELYIKFFTC